jgi:hypothetical protein
MKRYFITFLFYYLLPKHRMMINSVNRNYVLMHQTRYYHLETIKLWTPSLNTLYLFLCGLLVTDPMEWEGQICGNRRISLHILEAWGVMLIVVNCLQNCPEGKSDSHNAVVKRCRLFVLRYVMEEVCCSFYLTEYFLYNSLHYSNTVSSDKFTWRQNPEDQLHHPHRREKLKSHCFFCYLP